jgi:predicted glycoside hydrolase/deacetylase ChbG (UPF0249 family)
MSEKLLLINADGYGFTAGLNRGIEEAIDHGVVTSISVNSNFEAALELEALIARRPDISVGVHLNPVAGKPVSPRDEVPTLVDEAGEFHLDSFTAKLGSGHIDLGELALELGRQIERVQGLVPTITHLDGHQDRHVWPKFYDVFLDLAKRYGIGRMRTHARRIGMEHRHRTLRTGVYYATHPKRTAVQVYGRYLMRKARRRGLRMCDRRLSIEASTPRSTEEMLDAWLQLARSCPTGTNEMVCHPGYVDDELRRWARKTLDQRERERLAVTDPRLRTAFDDHGIRLISFHDI